MKYLIINYNHETTVLFDVNLEGAKNQASAFLDGKTHIYHVDEEWTTKPTVIITEVKTEAY